MPRIDLNCDMGESFGAWSMGNDRDVLEHVDSANIACGFHAGDAGTMRRTVEAAHARGVSIGAHPGFPDLGGFGRRPMALGPDEVYDDVLYQVGALAGIARAQGARLAHVKAHGALYNMAAKDAALADAIASAVRDFDGSLILYGLAGSELIGAAARAGIRAASEVFADRSYQDDGTLTPRKQPGAMIEDVEQAIVQVRRMVLEGVVRSIAGKDVAVRADTLCIHGDQPGAVAFAKRIREELAREGVALGPIAAL
ncbi:MAG: LamB/YcsF family protein [Burkholderiaceae bacterium]|nr:LamB/YcsF family protein [Burkholderiaceae bacterium]